MGQVHTRTVRLRDGILERRVVKILICVDRIFKETGGSVHCLKFLLKFQGLNNRNFLKICKQKYEFLLTLSHAVSYPFCVGALAPQW